MTGTQTLAARAALGMVAAVVSFAAVGVRRFQTMSKEGFDRLVLGALLASRVGLYLLIFFVLRIPVRGDVLGFYLPEGLRALTGGLPYREILTSYAPLHPFLDAAVLSVWHSPLALILLAIVVELCLLPVWLGLARGGFAEDTVRIAALLYVASPISLQNVAIDGQDNVLIALLLALALWAGFKARPFVSGALVAVGVVTVKFLPLLYVPLYLAAARRRLLWLLGLITVLVVGYGPFALKHLPLLYPLQFEGQERTASNLPYLVESVLGVSLPGVLETAVLGAAVLLVLLVVARRMGGVLAAEKMRLVAFGSVAVTLALLLFSKKSWPPYLMLVLFPICLLMGSGERQRLRVGLFCAFQVVALLAHSVWATVFSQFLAPAFHAALGTRQPAVLGFLLLQLLLVAGYAWLLWEAMVAVRRPAE